MAGGQSDEAPAATVGAGSFERQISQRDLLRELDRLIEKVAAWGKERDRLRAEREAAERKAGALREEKQQLLADAGVDDRRTLLEKMARLSELERTHEAMLRERAEMARRLELLIEKVDLLREGS
ncbi:MAG: hypothetical protein GF330_09395 [Candidatus Eisenbacteria bacterium]|nr:hypothetical protein [Candidatus Eisenbacteria bacterium]